MSVANINDYQDQIFFILYKDHLILQNTIHTPHQDFKMAHNFLMDIVFITSSHINVSISS